MLFALRDYVAKEKRVSLAQLARFFKVDVTALEPMLDVWIRKGVLKQDVQKMACKTACLGCSREAAIYYQYLS